MVNIEKLFMVQQSCAWRKFYQMDFMKKEWCVTKSRSDVQFVKKIFLEMVIRQQMKEEKHDQNY